MKKMSYAEAIREGMSIRMREDPNVLLFGEDVGAFGGCFGVSAGMLDEFGEKRVRDTPISEGAIIGAAVGSAATGLRPIAELMFCDFLTVGMDQLDNQAAKMRYMFGGKISMPMVVRLPAGAGVSAAAQHSQSLEAWITHVPGLKVVYPSTPQDALGLMLSSIDDDNPVMFLEHKAIYTMKGDVDSLTPIPLGKGDIKRAGEDVTIIATGKMVHEALAAAKMLEADGISAAVPEQDPQSSDRDGRKPQRRLRRGDFRYDRRRNVRPARLPHCSHWCAGYAGSLRPRSGAGLPAQCTGYCQRHPRTGIRSVE